MMKKTNAQRITTTIATDYIRGDIHYLLQAIHDCCQTLTIMTAVSKLVPQAHVVVRVKSAIVVNNKPLKTQMLRC